MTNQNTHDHQTDSPEESFDDNQSGQPQKKSVIFSGIKAAGKFVFVSIPSSVLGYKSIKKNNEYIGMMISSLRNKNEPESALNEPKQDIKAKAPIDISRTSKKILWISVLIGVVFVYNAYLLATNITYHFRDFNWLVNLAFGIFLITLVLVLNYMNFANQCRANNQPLIAFTDWLYSFLPSKKSK